MQLLELIPRNIPQLIDDSKQLISHFPFLNGINIPDVLRIPNRSHDAAHALLQHNLTAIPHIRSVDRPLEETLRIVSELITNGLQHVLIVSGDQNPDISLTYDVTAVTLINAIKENFPSLKVYGALDPYRSSFQQEIDYCKEKLDSGADGFFTQPFFDIKTAENYINTLKDCDIFAGYSPVTTEASKAYWEKVNRVLFPESFKLDLDYNAQLAAQLITLTKANNQHIYHMPIKVDPTQYLTSVQNQL